jgi:WD40 repeat protein
MDGSALFEVWDLSPKPVEEPPDRIEAEQNWWRRDMYERNVALRRGCENSLGRLTDLAFDGRFLAAVAGDMPVILLWDSHDMPSAEDLPSDSEAELDWDVAPQEGAKVDVGFTPQCVCFAPGGSLLAAGGAGLVLVDASTSSRRPMGRVGATVTAVGFSGDGRELLAGTEDGSVEIRDNESLRLLRAFDWGCGPISAVTFAPDGCTCAAGTETGQIVVWDRDGD